MAVARAQERGPKVTPSTLKLDLGISASKRHGPRPVPIVQGTDGLRVALNANVPNVHIAGHNRKASTDDRRRFTLDVHSPRNRNKP